MADGLANDLRTRLDADDPCFGVLDNAYSPDLVEFYGELGVDFVWIDLEHGGPAGDDAAALAELLRAAERGGTELLVRVPAADPSLVRKALDAGARNVFVPRVETAAEVREVVRAARFEHDGGPGERGLASPRARRWGLAEDYPDTEDRETLVGVTVETTAAVENVDDILDVPDLGFVFLGPLDLSVATEDPGNLDHPAVESALAEVRKAALDAGVTVGGLAFGTDDAVAKVDAGYRILNLGSTTGALKGTVGGWLDDVRPD